MYEIKRGGHADMKRIYPMMKYDFKDWERPSLVECQVALLKGAELLLLKDENGFECGYALMLRDRAHRYALLGCGEVSPAWLLYSAVVALVTLAAGVVLFSRVEKTFMDTV